MSAKLGSRQRGQRRTPEGEPTLTVRVGDLDRENSVVVLCPDLVLLDLARELQLAHEVAEPGAAVQELAVLALALGTLEPPSNGQQVPDISPDE